MNKITLIGRVGRVDVKTFTNGNKIVEASLATSFRYKDRDGNRQELTDWHNLVFNGVQADIVERYVTKGDMLAVQGRMTYREYTDANGVKKTIAEVRVDELDLLRRRHPHGRPNPQPEARHPLKLETISPSKLWPTRRTSAATATSSAIRESVAYRR